MQNAALLFEAYDCLIRVLALDFRSLPSVFFLASRAFKCIAIAPISCARGAHVSLLLPCILRLSRPCFDRNHRSHFDRSGVYSPFVRERPPNVDMGAMICAFRAVQIPYDL